MNPVQAAALVALAAGVVLLLGLGEWGVRFASDRPTAGFWGGLLVVVVSLLSLAGMLLVAAGMLWVAVNVASL